MAIKTIMLALLMAGLMVSTVYAEEWPQDGHDAQRSGYTLEEPLTSSSYPWSTPPWTFFWKWNASDASGGNTCTLNDPRTGHCYDFPGSGTPWEARTVTGGGNIYVPANNYGLYALSKSGGQPIWNVRVTNFNATPVYDANSNTVIAGGDNGTIYRINASTGTVEGTYPTGSRVRKSLLLVSGYVFAVNDEGQLHKVRIADMQGMWVYYAKNYHALATGQTPPSYSQTRDAIYYATGDLYVQAVNNSNGSQKWRVKPTVINEPFDGELVEFDGSWPVVAEINGVVFVKLSLGNLNLVACGGCGLSGSRWPTTNTGIREALMNNPTQKTLFALNLDNGSEKFVPAVAPTGVEDRIGPDLTPTRVVSRMLVSPVVKVYPNGEEVAYLQWQNGDSRSAADYRSDAHMGEMVLNGNTVPGLAAGDVRFVKFEEHGTRSGSTKGWYISISDEAAPITMAGNTLFNSHWRAVEMATVTDRNDSLGLTRTAPIESVKLPILVRRLDDYCAKGTNQWTNCSMFFLYDDGSSWPGPAGWWTYWNAYDPPIKNCTSAPCTYGMMPRYTYVSSGLVVVEGSGGDLMVFKHAGYDAPPATPTPLPTTTPSPTPTPTPAKPGDANGDNKVDGVDYIVWLNHYGSSVNGSINGDFNNSGNVDGVDYVIWLNNYGK